MTDTEIATTAEAYEATALPRRLEAHTDDSPRGVRDDCVTDRPVAHKSAAEWAYERLVLYIRDFEADLDNAHEVAMGFTGSQAGVMRIEGMGFFDPDILTFYGTDPQGGRSQLVQHVSQLNVMLRALPKLVETEAPRRIGFRLAQKLEDAARDPVEEAT
ncbi:DUF6173 family protein [Marinovum sp.]|uniref:DUF6173 family protein n=1 Tax=Marinovum sp. TaxID=2024839 RepID=UPI002B27641E|nr:DUF6173 family protein [Marinovum sp.]